MNAASLVDFQAAAIVLGGTLLATILRCGWSDCRVAIAALAQLGREHFHSQEVRAELAIQIREIHENGLLRAEPHQFGDREFDEAADALIGSRSISAIHKAHERHRQMRFAVSERAVRTLAQASELAPVFGLAGTLLALSQLPADGLAASDYAQAVSVAVLTTLYGLLLANLLFAPLARAVDRAAQAEERERQKVVDWLAEQLEDDVPQRHPVKSAHLARVVGAP